MSHGPPGGPKEFNIAKGSFVLDYSQSFETHSPVNTAAQPPSGKDRRKVTVSDSSGGHQQGKEMRIQSEKQPIPDPSKTIASCLLNSKLSMEFDPGIKKALIAIVSGEQGGVFSSVLFSEDKGVKTIPKQIVSNMASGITEGGNETLKSLFTYNPEKPDAEEAKIGGLIALLKYYTIIREEADEYSYTDAPSDQPGFIKKHAEAGKKLHLYLDYYLERIAGNTLSEDERKFLESENSFLPVFLEYQRIARNTKADIPGLRPDIREDFAKAQASNSIPLLPDMIQREGSRRSSGFLREQKELNKLIAELREQYDSALRVASFISSFENKHIKEFPPDLSSADIAKYLATFQSYSDYFMYFLSGWHLHTSVGKMGKTFQQFMQISETHEQLGQVNKEVFSETVENFLAYDPFDALPENFPSPSEIANLPLPLTPEAKAILAPVFAVPEHFDSSLLRLFYMQMATALQGEIINIFVKKFDQNPIKQLVPKNMYDLFQNMHRRLAAYTNDQSTEGDTPDISYIPIVKLSQEVKQNGEILLPKVLKSYLKYQPGFILADEVVESLYQAAESNFLWSSKKRGLPTKDWKTRNPYKILTDTQDPDADSYLERLNTVYQEKPEVPEEIVNTFFSNFLPLYSHIRKTRSGIITLKAKEIGDIDLAVRPDAEIINIFLISPDNKTELALQLTDTFYLTYPHVLNWHHNLVSSVFAEINAQLSKDILKGQTTVPKHLPTRSFSLPILPVTQFPKQTTEIISRPPKVKTRPDRPESADTAPETKPAQAPEKKVTVILSDELLKTSKIPEIYHDKMRKAVELVELEGLRPPRVKKYIVAEGIYRITAGKYRLKMEQISPGVYQVTKIVDKKDIVTSKKLEGFLYS